MDTIRFHLRFSETSTKDILRFANDEQLKEIQEYFKGQQIEKLCKQVREERDAKKAKKGILA